MKKFIITVAFFSFFFTCTINTMAFDISIQDAKHDSCNTPEANQFDFWIGEWNLEWDEENRGSNVIEKTLDGCVITENFDGTPSIDLRGKSVSMFNQRTGKWHQTWVDNQGSYLDFTGEFQDGKMVLQRTSVINEEDVLQRMVWYEIEEDSLLWNWERSDDNGETWTVLWKIHYERVK